MKETKKRRPLGRGWKIALNCLAVLALLFGVWVMSGSPLPTAELRFHRAEKEHLITQPSEILGSVVRDNYLWMVGTSGDAVTLYKEGYRRSSPDGSMYLYERREGGRLIFIGNRIGTGHNMPWVLAADVPREAARASLTLRMQSVVYVDFQPDGTRDFRYGRPASRPEPEGYTRVDLDETYQLEGTKLDVGLFYFALKRNYPDMDTPEGFAEVLLLDAIAGEAEQGTYISKDVNWSMTAELYNEDGTAIGTVERSDWEA